MRKIHFDFNRTMAVILRTISFIGTKKVKENYATVSEGKRKYDHGSGWVSREGDPSNNDTMRLSNSVRGKIEGNKLRISVGGTGGVAYARRQEEEYNRPNLKTLMPGLINNRYVIRKFIEIIEKNMEQK